MKMLIALVRSGLTATALVALAGAGHAQGARTVEPYKLAPGDTLAVSVANETELSGKFVVDDAGNITLPIIGPIPVGDRTIPDSQEIVRSTLSRNLLKHPVVYVHMDTFRPVSVLGDVRLAGVYPYVPGKIAKMLVAQAGGYGLAELSANPAELLVANERMSILATSHDRLLIRKARLEAQLAGESQFKAPKTQLIAAETAVQLVAEEQAHLESQARARAAQVELLELQRPLLATEETSLEGQIAAESSQATLLRGRLAEFEKLENKGLSRSSNVIELRLTLATKEGNIWALKAQQTRTSVARTELDNKLLELTNQYKTRLTTELDDIRRQLLEIDVTLPSSRRIVARRTQAASRTGAGDSGHTIHIIRYKSGAQLEFEAAELTPIEPGDVIEVRARSASMLAPADGRSADR